MDKYLKFVPFIYSWGLSQPSNEHKPFMKGSEEPCTSVHVREQQEMEKGLTGFLTLPSEPCWIFPLLQVSKGNGRVLWAERSSNSFGNVPATSNSISSTTLLVRAASRRSWLASSMVPSSVAMPLMERTLSPTCSSPHLQFTVGKEGMGTRRQGERGKEEQNNPTTSHELLLPGKSVTRRTKQWQILQEVAPKRK